MGKFLNDLKRAFTAPKTRHMDGKIKSMKDYMGLTKKLFGQMKDDAEFFKICEEKFNKSIIRLNNTCNMSSLSGILNTTQATATDGTIFGEILKHKINWYHGDDADIKNFITNTNKKIADYTGTDLDAIRDLKAAIEKDSESHEYHSQHACISVSHTKRKSYYTLIEKYRSFCRETKQKIKELFETKQKEFEKQRKNEKISLQLLHNKTENLETHLNAKNFRTALQTWADIQNYYEQNNTQDNTATKQLTNITYQIAKQTIQNHIKTRIKTLCNNINTTLNSYVTDDKYENTNQLKREDKDKLRNLTEEFYTLINDCLKAEEHTLNTIGTSPENLNKILKHITAATSEFLDPANETHINEIEFSCALNSINNILKEWT